MASDASAPSKIETFDDFVRVHGLLLAASGLPPQLHRPLFEKLSAEIFDGGAYFQIAPTDEEGRQRRLVMTSDFMGKESNVFLVDHAWTFRLSDAYKQVTLSFLLMSVVALLVSCGMTRQVLRHMDAGKLLLLLLN